jgi:hypothetical protein
MNPRKGLLLDVKYVGKELHEYDLIERKMKRMLIQVVEEYAKVLL